MRNVRSIFTIVAVVGAIAALVPSADAALVSKLTGVPHFTARLSSNKAIRRQQLIVDPDGVVGGSVTTDYDPALVHLSGLLDTGDFQITAGFVAVGGGPHSSPIRVPIDEFLNPAPEAGAAARDAGRRELGNVQLFFSRRPALRAAPTSAGDDDSTIPNLPGYVTVDQDGPTGVGDTHALTFDYLSADPHTRVTYHVLAASPTVGTGDTLVLADDPEHPVPFDRIGGATVSGGLEPSFGVPLPPAASAGMAVLAAMSIVHIVRRGRRGC